jgi:tetratricopeptide (TPR) repeat protein
LAGENESTIFRLFGLAPQAYGIPVPAHEAVSVIHIPTQTLSDQLLQEYHQRQKAFFTEYYTSHGQNIVGEALEWVQQLPVLMPQAKTTAQRVSLLALQSRNHRLLACIAREQCEKERLLFHTGQAIELAEQALTLPNPALSDDRAELLITNELLASALLTTAIAYYELDEYDLAQEAIDRALKLLPTLRSSQLKRHILADAGLIHAYTATTPTDQTLVFSYFNLAAQISSHANVPDDNLILCGKATLYICKAMALSSSKMKGATAEKVLDLLEDAQRVTNHFMIRQQVIIEVLRARVHFAEGSYQDAIEVALSALEKSRQIQSRLNRDRIEGLYRQLLDTSFRDKPRLSHLNVKLRTWDHDMDWGA